MDEEGGEKMLHLIGSSVAAVLSLNLATGMFLLEVIHTEDRFN